MLLLAKGRQIKVSANYFPYPVQKKEVEAQPYKKTEGRR